MGKQETLKRNLKKDRKCGDIDGNKMEIQRDVWSTNLMFSGNLSPNIKNS